MFYVSCLRQNMTQPGRNNPAQPLITTDQLPDFASASV
jgi:hypothetical protein